DTVGRVRALLRHAPTGGRPLHTIDAGLALAGQAPANVADGDLLARFLDRHDEAAFRALLRRHGAMVLGVCRRLLRHEQDAEDATQATFLVLATRAADIRNGPSVGSWLHGVACRIAGRARRTAARRQGRERCAARRAPASPVLEAAGRELQAALDEAL